MEGSKIRTFHDAIHSGKLLNEAIELSGVSLATAKIQANKKRFDQMCAKWACVKKGKDEVNVVNRRKIAKKEVEDEIVPEE